MKPAAPWIELDLSKLWLSGTMRSTVAVPGYQHINGVNDHILGMRLWVSDHMEFALR
jgi:hypothetical protein